MNGSNSNSDPSEQESIAAELTPRAYRVGVDATGTEHWHDAFEGQLWLVQPDGTIQTADLRRRSIAEWVQFVADTYGAWETRQPVEQSSGLAGIVDDVQEGSNA